MPLNVTAFQADGFGDLTDAINLATGNVYLNVAGVSMNNFMGSGDDTSRAIGAEGWSLNARLRLQGFYKGLSSAPSGFFLGRGRRRRHALRALHGFELQQRALLDRALRERLERLCVP